MAFQLKPEEIEWICFSETQREDISDRGKEQKSMGTCKKRKGGGKCGAFMKFKMNSGCYIIQAFQPD